MNKLVILTALHFLSITFTLFLGGWGYRKLDRPLRLLLILFMVMFAVEAYNLYRLFHHLPNQWLYHVYMLIEFTLLMRIFSYWQTNKNVVKSINIINAAFLLLCVVNYIWFDVKILILKDGALHINTSATYNFIPIQVACVFYAAISAYTLFNLLRQDKGDIMKLPPFWVSAALLVFSSGTIVYFITNQIARSIGADFIPVLVAHLIINIIVNIIYAIGFWIQMSYIEE